MVSAIHLASQKVSQRTNVCLAIQLGYCFFHRHELLQPFSLTTSVSQDRSNRIIPGYTGSYMLSCETILVLRPTSLHLGHISVLDSHFHLDYQESILPLSWERRVTLLDEWIDMWRYEVECSFYAANEKTHLRCVSYRARKCGPGHTRGLLIRRRKSRENVVGS